MKDQASNLRKLVVSKLNEEDFRLVSLVSMDENVGKSQLVVDLAAQLKELGQEVLIVRISNEEDENPSKDIEGLDDFYSEGFNKDNIMINEDRIHVLPLNVNYSLIDVLEEDSIEKIMKSLLFFESYNYILIDTIAGTNRSTIDIMKLSNESIYVYSEDESDIIETYKFTKILCQNDYDKDLSLIMNKVKDREKCEETTKNLSYTVNEFLCLNISNLGMLRYSDMLKDKKDLESAFSGKYPRALFSQDLKEVLDKIIEGEKLNIYNEETLKEKLIEVYGTDKNL